MKVPKSRQALSELPLGRVSAPISRVQRYPLIEPAIHGVEVDLEDKHPVK